MKLTQEQIEKADEWFQHWVGYSAVWKTQLEQLAAILQYVHTEPGAGLTLGECEQIERAAVA